MGNCASDDDGMRQRKGAYEPQRHPDTRTERGLHTKRLQAEAAKGTPKGDEHDGRGGELRPGDRVDAWWEGAWHPARIRTARSDGSFDIDWTDGTMSYGVSADYMRKSGPAQHDGHKVRIANSVITNDTPTEKMGEQLFESLGGTPGHVIPVEQAQRRFRNVRVVDFFGWPRGRVDELVHLLCSADNGVTLESCRHYAHVKWLFALIDTDANQRISAWELETALIHNTTVRQELGISSELAAPLFRQMDTDNSGWISNCEFFRFYARNPLRKKHRNKSDQSVVKRLFDRLDAGRTGQVTQRGLARALQADTSISLELGWPPHQASKLFEFLDTDNSGAVTLDELRSFMRVQLLFNRIDCNKSGFIDPFEFGEALGDPQLAAELRVSQHQAQSVFGKIDRDRSGSITFAEFFGYFSQRLAPEKEGNDRRHHQQKRLVGAEKYDIVKKIGEGTFGLVYLIKRKTDGLDLIMKKPKLVPGSNMDDVKAEADMLARLKHPHIVRFTESYWENGALIIITEFAGGGDIRSKIKRNGCGMENCMRWFIESCSAVKYLHDRFILHRDLKPDNIFLTTGGCVKVGDLGLATQLRNPQDMAMTQCGTQIYMAPELMRGDPYDEKNDVWALGCILYEMATGKYAFETIASIVEADAPRDAPKYCAVLVSDMLEADPRNRPSISEVLEDLEHDIDPTGMASYMSDRYRGGGGGGKLIHPNDVYDNRNNGYYNPRY